MYIFEMLILAEYPPFTSLALILSIANALDVTANDLLFDYLTEMSKSLGSEVYDLMYDCTPAEKAILMDMLRHMVSANHPRPPQKNKNEV